MNQRRREQYGWSVLIVVALVPLVFGVKGLITGAPGNPAVVAELTGMEWELLRTGQPGVSVVGLLLSRPRSLAARDTAGSPV